MIKFEWGKAMVEVCFILLSFSLSFYSVVINLMGNGSTGIYYKVYSIFLLLVIVSMFIGDFIKDKRSKNRYAILLISIFIVIILCIYFLTYIFYASHNELYFSTLFNILLKFPPAVMIGYLSAKNKNNLVNFTKIIPYLVVIYTLSLFIFVLSREGYNEGINSYNSGLFNYQSISYYIAYAFGFLMFILMNIRKLKKSDNYFYSYVLIIVVIFIQFYILFSTGGRGAFVLIVVVIIFYLLRMKRENKGIAFIILLFGIAFVIVLRNGTGFQRIFSIFEVFNLNSGSSERLRIYINAIKLSLDNFPKFNLAGSVFYTMNTYSHNIFLDISLEWGIFSLILFEILILYIGYKSLIFINLDFRFEIIFLILMYSITLLLFSGYYLEDPMFWSIITFIIFASKEKVDNVKEDNKNTHCIT